MHRRTNQDGDASVVHLGELPEHSWADRMEGVEHRAQGQTSKRTPQEDEYWPAWQWLGSVRHLRQQVSTELRRRAWPTPIAPTSTRWPTWWATPDILVNTVFAPARTSTTLLSACELGPGR